MLVDLINFGGVVRGGKRRRSDYEGTVVHWERKNVQEPDSLTGAKRENYEIWVLPEKNRSIRLLVRLSSPATQKSSGVQLTVELVPALVYICIFAKLIYP